MVKKTKMTIDVKMAGEDEKREVDKLFKLAEQIRYIMQTRGTNTLKMPIILKMIDERQQIVGEFTHKSKFGLQFFFLFCFCKSKSNKIFIAHIYTFNE